MSARLKASLRESVEVPPLAEEPFLTKAMEVLERLRSESEKRGHALLASLLEIARGEAEDGLKTRTEVLRVAPAPVHILDEGVEDEEGVVRMAEKFAWRAGAERVN